MYTFHPTTFLQTGVYKTIILKSIPIRTKAIVEWAIISSGAVYYDAQDGWTFWDCWWNANVVDKNLKCKITVTISWDVALNTRREIPYLRATMCYFVYYKKTHTHKSPQYDWNNFYLKATTVSVKAENKTNSSSTDSNKQFSNTFINTMENFSLLFYFHFIITYYYSLRFICPYSLEDNLKSPYLLAPD